MINYFDTFKKKECNLIVILGPTASGKTRLAVKLAIELGSEIISADSRQVYRDLNIGTGKDIDEYKINDKIVPYHLIDVVGPEEEFNVFEYRRLFFLSFDEILCRGVVPIMVGGSGMYIESIVMNFQMLEVPENADLREELMNMKMDVLIERLYRANPNIHNTTDLLDKNRLIRAIEIAEFTNLNRRHEENLFVKPLVSNPIILGIKWKRDILRKRITERLTKRLADGMIDEVRDLHNDNDIAWEKLDYWGLEYRYISRYLQGKLTYNDMYQKLNTKIHQFAKRQETWFRRMEKRGLIINWIEGDDFSKIKQSLSGILDEIQ